MARCFPSWEKARALKGLLKHAVTTSQCSHPKQRWPTAFGPEGRGCGAPRTLPARVDDVSLLVLLWVKQNDDAPETQKRSYKTPRCKVERPGWGRPGSPCRVSDQAAVGVRGQAAAAGRGDAQNLLQTHLKRNTQSCFKTHLNRNSCGHSFASCGNNNRISFLNVSLIAVMDEKAKDQNFGLL